MIYYLPSLANGVIELVEIYPWLISTAMDNSELKLSGDDDDDGC